MTDKTLGAYVRTTPHPDDMDGGVTAALIENEVTDPDGDGLSITTQGGQVWITCTAQRHEVTIGPIRKDVLAEMVQDRDADDSRPLTPDAITDEMVERGLGAMISTTTIGAPFIREVLTAALTEPPARPAWQDLADEVEDLMTPPTPATPALLARLLYARGVRVVGGEDPR